MLDIYIGIESAGKILMINKDNQQIYVQDNDPDVFTKAIYSGIIPVQVEGSRGYPFDWYIDLEDLNENEKEEFHQIKRELVLYAMKWYES